MSLWASGRHNSPPANSVMDSSFFRPDSSHILVDAVHQSMRRSSSSSTRWYLLQCVSSNAFLVSSLHISTPPQSCFPVWHQPLEMELHITVHMFSSHVVVEGTAWYYFPDQSRKELRTNIIVHPTIGIVKLWSQLISLGCTENKANLNRDLKRVIKNGWLPKLFCSCHWQVFYFIYFYRCIDLCLMHL